MLFLCVSDIHGHLDALRAVLATAERRSFHKLLVAGDLLFPGPDALETWRRLNAAGAIMVQGLTDRALATLDPDALHARSDFERERLDRMKATRDALGELILQRIRRLPTHHRIPLEDGGELVLVHGSPADPGEALTHDMNDEEINALLGDDPADLVVCGASHVPFDRMVGTVRVVNVGSVGEAPGDGPRVAHATWIESTPRGIFVESIAVPLDGSPAMAARLSPTSRHSAPVPRESGSQSVQPATIGVVNRPGIAKARGLSFVLERRGTHLRAPDCRWRELLDRADIVSEGSAREEPTGRIWYGSTSLILCITAPESVPADPATLAHLAARSAHVRLRSVRTAHREACLRAPGRLGRVTCEMRFSPDSRGVRIDVDIQAPLIERRAQPRRAQ